MNWLRGMTREGQYLTYRDEFMWVMVCTCVLGMLSSSVFLYAISIYSPLHRLKIKTKYSSKPLATIFALGHIAVIGVTNPLYLFYITCGRFGFMIYYSPMIHGGCLLVFVAFNLWDSAAIVKRLCVWNIAINMYLFIQTVTMFDELGDDWVVTIGTCASAPVLIAVNYSYIFNPTRVVKPIKTQYTFMLGLVISIGGILFTIFLAGVCLTPFNVSLPVWQIEFPGQVMFSTRFMRSVSSKRFCDEAVVGLHKPCQVYLTAGADLAREVFVNVHFPISQKPIDILQIEYGQVGAMGNVNSTTAKHFPIALLDAWDQRNVYSAVIADLLPNTEYFFRFVVDTGGTIDQQYYFRTPALEGPFSFVSGGDAGVTVTAQKNFHQMSTTQPSLIVIGGDVAYDNGMYSCYCSWDYWLASWAAQFRERNLLVPFAFAVGNHDLGVSDNNDRAYLPNSDKCDANDINYAPSPIMAFFPFDYDYFGVQNGEITSKRPSPICSRKTARIHSLGKLISLWMLDSAYGVEPLDMVKFVNDNLPNALSTTNIAVYHVPLYSACTGDYPSADYLRDIWGTQIFGDHAGFFQIALEHHSHLYKRTKPMNGNTVFVGDGNLGIPHSIDSSDGELDKGRTDLLVANNKNHFIKVEVGLSSLNLTAIDENGQPFDHYQKEL